MKKIVIVGGGAGGLELVTRLGKTLGRKNKADIVLIDRSPIHLWKPLLHEVASGSLDINVDSISYRAHAYQHHYVFKSGKLLGVDREQKKIHLDVLLDEQGNEVLPAREQAYDYLILAIGSVTNDFGIKGVAEHCVLLDNFEQARRFHHRMLNRFIQINRKLANKDDVDKLKVTIVGGGATGVELAAELVRARELFAVYGLKNVRPDHLHISLIEAGERLVPSLSERLSSATRRELEELGVKVRTQTMISQVNRRSLITKAGDEIQSDFMVWAAGIKAPDFLNSIQGLETNRLNQIIVEQELTAKGDKSIFVIGDCAGFALKDEQNRTLWVPPRAQSAHQMAALVARNLNLLVENKPLREFQYKDYGSLVSLSNYAAFGRLMGALSRGSLSIEGRIARMAYLTLYRMHQVAVHGWIRTVLIYLSDKINRYIRPKIKLH